MWWKRYGKSWKSSASMLVVRSQNLLANGSVGSSYTYLRDGRALAGKALNSPNHTLLVRESGGPGGTVTVP